MRAFILSTMVLVLLAGCTQRAETPPKTGQDTSSNAVFEAAPESSLGADAPVVGVGAVEDLVHQEQHAGALVGQGDDGAQPRDLGKEPRCTSPQRVLHPQRGSDAQRR